MAPLRQSDLAALHDMLPFFVRIIGWGEGMNSRIVTVTHRKKKTLSFWEVTLHLSLDASIFFFFKEFYLFIYWSFLFSPMVSGRMKAWLGVINLQDLFRFLNFKWIFFLMFYLQLGEVLNSFVCLNSGNSCLNFSKLSKLCHKERQK